MPIHEERILDDVELKFKNRPHPVPGHPNLPQGMFLAAYIGKRASGKTHLAAELVKRYERHHYVDEHYANLHGEAEWPKVPMRTILFSPTIHANPVYNSLRTLAPADRHGHFTHQKFQEVWQDIKTQNKLADEYQEDLALWNKAQRGAQLTDKERIRLTHVLGNREPEPKGRYRLPPVTHLIMDDLANTDAFKLSPHNALSNAAIRNRHNRVAMHFLVQAGKAIPKLVRQNLSVLALGKFSSADYALKDLHEGLVDGLLTKEDFTQLYNHATSKKYGFLTLDLDKGESGLSFKTRLHLTPSTTAPSHETQQDQHQDTDAAATLLKRAVR